MVTQKLVLAKLFLRRPNVLDHVSPALLLSQLKKYSNSEYYDCSRNIISSAPSIVPPKHTSILLKQITEEKTADKQF